MARIAIVTGAASSIGRALAAALVARGDTVVMADIDGEAAERGAHELTRHAPGAATAAVVDVRDAAAVQALVHGTRGRYGRLDVMVNNADISVGGEARELLLAHWDRVLDVNLRGVVHGVHAAYPVMLAQRPGHIANTASLADLLLAPGLTPYAMTKHAAVGLSLSLRAEAAAYGVRVTAVCPGFVDTSILEKGGPDDLPKPAGSEHWREMAQRPPAPPLQRGPARARHPEGNRPQRRADHRASIRAGRLVPVAVGAVDRQPGCRAPAGLVPRHVRQASRTGGYQPQPGVRREKGRCPR